MNLAERMKKYEACYDITMPLRVPVIIRIDGKKFSKYTKKFSKPFDEHLVNAMTEATKQTFLKIEGCLFGFTQSDEATLVLRNDQSLDSEAWSNNRIQKICSISASIFTATFMANVPSIHGPAYFDSRVFVVPNIDEVINNLIWRQRDATKNSIQGTVFYTLSSVVGKKTALKLMHGLRGNELQELLFQKTGVNWNLTPTHLKRGTGIYKKRHTTKDQFGNEINRPLFMVDKELPIFSQQRDFLTRILDIRNIDEQ